MHPLCSHNDHAVLRKLYAVSPGGALCTIYATPCQSGLSSATVYILDDAKKGIRWLIMLEEFVSARPA